MIVPAGALMENGTWKHSRKRGKYLFKVDMLSDAFRGRFVARVRELLAEKSIIGQMPPGLFDKPWVVYAKRRTQTGGQLPGALHAQDGHFQ
jgi:hypothetical protein